MATNSSMTTGLVLADVRAYKIIVIGDSAVGKTCLTYRFCENKFYSSIPTIGIDFREKTLDVGGEMIKLQLWDTAGQERYRNSIMNSYFRHVDAVVLVYDVTNMSSFIALDKWLKECADNNVEHVQKILVGNKCDADNKVVSIDQAMRFADQHNMAFFETSAKLNTESEHIESIFLTLAHKLKNSQPLRTASVPGTTLNSDNIQGSNTKCCFF